MSKNRSNQTETASDSSDSESEKSIFTKNDSPKSLTKANSSDFSDSQSKSASKSKSKSDDSDLSDKLITFIKLEDDGETEITQIYHISDIHIRNTQRHIEYKDVFERTYHELKTRIGSNMSSSLIVLTGDIMHAKTELSPESFTMAQNFFKELCVIAPVILIPGNHDCNLSNRDRLDALTPIVSANNKMDNLYYLKKSGIYQYYNIVFGVTSIFDDVLIKSSKIDKINWANIKQKNKYKIALYHGPVHGAITDVGYRMNNDQLLADDFEGYDYVMLGDIHKFQYMNETETIAYAGSLIQQSYGESLTGHGILKWDLDEGISNLIEIKNDYGYCTIRIVDGVIASNNIKIPRKPRIRFILENTSQIQYQEVLTMLESKHQICEVVKNTDFRTRIHINSPTQAKASATATACTTQEKIIKSYLRQKKMEADKIDSLLELHKKIYQKIFNDKKDQVADTMHNATKIQKWRLLELQFSNTLSYGTGNIINFTKYDSNKIIGILAPNHYGKSAILDIILFCLFDKCSRGERRDILNKNEKSMKCSLLLSVGSQEYLIERIGQRSKNGLTVKIDVNFYSISKSDSGKKLKENLNGLDKNETNRKIVDLIGDYNDYLTTCFCLQQGKTVNFIDMTQLQKKEYLNEILKLNVFEDCYNVAKDKLKKLSAQLKIFEQKIGTKSMKDLSIAIKENTSLIKNLELKKFKLETFLSVQVDDILLSLPQATLTKYNELSNYNLKTENDILNAIDTVFNKIHTNTDIDTDSIIQRINDHRTKLTEYQLSMETLSTNTNNEELLTKQRMLMKQIINLSKNSIGTPDSLLEEKQSMLAKIDTIDRTLQNFSCDTVNDKIARIAELKTIINGLRKNLKPIDESVITKLDNIFTKVFDNKTKIVSLLDIAFKRDNKLISASELTELQSTIEHQRPFADHLGSNLDTLSKYQPSKTNTTNDDIVSIVKNNNQTWIDRYNRLATKYLKYKNEADNKTKQAKYPHMADLLDESSALQKETWHASFDMYSTIDNLMINRTINKKIRVAELELDSLKEFNGTKQQIDNLNKEKLLIREKIVIIDGKLNDIEIYNKNARSNAEIQTEIDDIQTILDKYNTEYKQLSKLIKDVTCSIDNDNRMIDAHKKQIDAKHKLKQQHILLQQYHLEYLNCYQRNLARDQWLTIRKDIDNEITDLSKQIDKLQVELAIYKKDIEQYLQYRQQYDDISAKTNLYQMYVQAMNYNGLPYEMLKTYLPLIEQDVNQILHSMVNFNIELMFFDEKKTDENKSKQVKSTAGSIDINICYQKMRPYSVQLSSGFERFIIGLAIRMTLCQISLTAKPNFLIIDEGWSCLDSENLNNVGTIMNYIKTQYEHIIIISHLEELKNQADYIINIEKKDGYSCVKIDNHMIVRRKKSKSKQIIEI